MPAQDRLRYGDVAVSDGIDLALAEREGQIDSGVALKYVGNVLCYCIFLNTWADDGPDYIRQHCPGHTILFYRREGPVIQPVPREVVAPAMGGVYPIYYPRAIPVEGWRQVGPNEAMLAEDVGCPIEPMVAGMDLTGWAIMGQFYEGHTPIGCFGVQLDPNNPSNTHVILRRIGAVSRRHGPQMNEKYATPLPLP